MLEQLDALRALHEAGTTRRAALTLRVSQSAISKRIAALEVRVGFPVVEPVGRRVRLTAAGLALLDGVLPHLRAIEASLRTPIASEVRISATESLLGSWLPRVFAAALASMAEPPPLTLHAHRGPLALERLRAGEVDLAVVVTHGEDGVHTEAVGLEPMVLLDGGGGVTWTIEASSLTGAWLGRRAALDGAPPLTRIESFASAIQLAGAGLGDALVPAGLARAYGAEGRPTQLARPIAVCVRPSAWERPVVRRFVRAVCAAGAEVLAGLG